MGGYRQVELNASLWASNSTCSTESSGADVVITVEDFSVKDEEPLKAGMGVSNTTHEVPDPPTVPRLQSSVASRVLLLVLFMPIILIIFTTAMVAATFTLLSGACFIADALMTQKKTQERLALEQFRGQDSVSIIPSLIVQRVVQYVLRVYRTWLVVFLQVSWFLPLRHCLQPDLIWVLYLESPVSAYKWLWVPELVRWTSGVLNAKTEIGLIPVSVIKGPHGWGMCVFVMNIGLDNLNKGTLHSIKTGVQESFPSAKAIAWAGRLPSLFAQAGVPLNLPSVDGLYGTVYSMTSCIRGLTGKAGLEQEDASLCVIGGAGFLGRRLVQDLQERCKFGQIIVLDKKCEALEPPSSSNEDQVFGVAMGHPLAGGGVSKTQSGCVVYTSDARWLSLADVVLVVTARGDDVGPYIVHARAGQVWGDDTHPEMGRHIITALQAKGVEVYKLFMTDHQLRFLPAIPGFPSVMAPGCIVMATTIVAHGPRASRSMVDFVEAADRMGYKPVLASHQR